MEMQHDVQVEETKQEWIAPELVKMDVSSGTLNTTGVGADSLGNS